MALIRNLRPLFEAGAMLGSRLTANEALTRIASVITTQCTGSLLTNAP